jgi:MFS transporter, OFA family, oxalate/formate antiporter
MAGRVLFWLGIGPRIGRENTMTVALGLEGLAMIVWLVKSNNVLLLVPMSRVFFGWDEIFSLFPSRLTDTFGTPDAIINYGFLYIAQGVASVFGGSLAALLHELTGIWILVFGVVIVMDLLTGLLAFFVLRPMHRRFLASKV